MASLDIDVGIRLMQLYRALRQSPDQREKDAIKGEIDALVAEAHATFDCQPTSPAAARPGSKPDA